MPAHSRKVEALAEAIVAYSGYLDPRSKLHAARNPGGLKATSGDHAKDEDGNRIFNSFLDGLRALCYDVELRLRGRSRHRVSPESTLLDLAFSYSRLQTQARTIARAWAKFLRHALHDDTITDSTALKFFLE